MKPVVKYFLFILTVLALTGCFLKTAGRLRLHPSNIRVSAEAAEVNVSCITGGYIMDIFTCGSDFQELLNSDPTYRIIRIEETNAAQINPLEAENEWIHVIMHSPYELTVRIKENDTGEKRYGMVAFKSVGHDTGGSLKITQDPK